MGRNHIKFVLSTVMGSRDLTGVPDCEYPDEVSIATGKIMRPREFTVYGSSLYKGRGSSFDHHVGKEWWPGEECVTSNVTSVTRNTPGQFPGSVQSSIATRLPRHSFPIEQLWVGTVQHTPCPSCTLSRSSHSTDGLFVLGPSSHPSR